MKNIIFLSIISVFSSFAIGYSSYPINSNTHEFSADTVIRASINPDRKMETITVTFPGMKGGSIYDYILTVDKDTARGVFELMDDAIVQLIDIDKTDGFTEIVITALGPSDNNDHKIFRFRGNEIIKVSDLSQYFGFTTDGDGVLKAEEWMGFWTKIELFKLDNEHNKLLLIPQDTYPLDIEVTVNEPFQILAERIDGSDIVQTLAPGAIITLTNADTSPKCLTEKGYVDDFFCDWYLIKTEDGMEGWARLETFKDLVDGLVWAG